MTVSIADPQARDEISDEAQFYITAEAKELLLSWPQEAVSQALIQLIRNAHQASSEGQPIQLSISAHQDGVTMNLKDQGVGMTEETLKRYGEPFFTTREGAGMGLGVFIAKSLIERLKGKLEVHSTSGSGTEVYVWLPTTIIDK